MNKTLQDQQKKLPKTPGVYFFLDKKKTIIYIGKASVLRTRTAAYFRDDLDLKTAQLMKNARDIKYVKSQTALEAMFLEARLIKKHQPQYNIKQKDDKSNTYLIITNEEIPRIEITRPTALHNFKIKESFGPFQSKKELEQALRILRKIFPYHSEKNFKKPCFHFQIGLCPGPCAGAISKKDYLKNIRNLSTIFKGGKKRIINRLEKRMRILSKNKNYEKAAVLRDTIAALNNHRDIQISQKDSINWKVVSDIPKRLEAYDISNISGKFATGSMVVFNFGRPDKTEYRKFKIKTLDKPNDTAMLKEVLKRRFNNAWERPSVIFIDGGLAQIRAASEVLRSLNLRIPLISVAKGAYRKGFRVFKSHKNLNVNAELLKEASQEAHRFAINYHRNLRDKNFLAF
ncbi:MAG: hypothetical protein GF335_00770 [Candidatus Moranbacteria bacterium]|nr:hypothetical protein [Candidatus Moranbacteria bacterium]